jgi:predicted ABC-type ATPase
MTKKTLTTKQPVATIIAGANDSGKSTLISSLYQSGFFCEEQFVGPDLILSNEISHTISRKKDTLYFIRNHYDEELYTRENYLMAFSIADERREALMEKRKDFVMETVLSTDSKMELIATLKEKGYFVRIIYTIPH